MREHTIFKFAGVILLVAAISGAAFWHVRESFAERQDAIVRDCVNAIPALTQRYRNLGALLALDLEGHQRTDSNGNKRIAWCQPSPILESFESKGPPPTANYLVMSSTDDHHWEMPEALNHFLNAPTPYQKAMGALTLEQWLETVLEPNGCYDDTVESSAAVARVKADVAATDWDAKEFVSETIERVDGYNRAVRNSLVASILHIKLIGRDTDVVQRGNAR